MKLNDLAKSINKNAVEHGWWDEDRKFPEVYKKGKIGVFRETLREAAIYDKNGVCTLAFRFPKPTKWSDSYTRSGVKVEF